MRGTIIGTYVMEKFTKKLVIAATLIFLIFTIWWLVILLSGQQGTNNVVAEDFGFSYGLMALYGGIIGIFASKKWGGFRSCIGKAIGFIALGLLAQEFGQVMYSYLGKTMETVPYPSVGDIGFFGSVILYLLGLWYLIAALKTKGSIKSAKNKLVVVVMPAALLVASYLIFLRGYEVDPSNTLATALDFGYPLGQAFYFSLAILAYVLSRKYLGGVMKPVILTLIAALLLQYVADFTFLYMNNRGLWKTAGINDFVYLVSYYVMTIGLLRFRISVDKLAAPSHLSSQTEEAS